MFTNINECINYIEKQSRKSVKDLSLMKRLCEAYGHPEQGLTFIHVAGTNGKGSVVAYLREILCAAGLHVGSFTSPYIEKFNERITLDKKFIPDDLVLKYSNEIVEKYDYLDRYNIEHPSFFSFITLMCFMYFRDVKPDVAIMEVGIGGLKDDTNVITPILSIISNISYDHMNILGDTIEKIAENKLGIVKDNVPLVTIENEQIEKLIVSTCEKHHSDFTIVKKKDIKNIESYIGTTSFDYVDKYKKNYHVNLNMSGIYQTENASIVIEACNYLKKYFIIDNDIILSGLKNTFWPGRLEVIHKNPYVIIDGAHNIDGITRLHEFIKTLKKYKIVLVLAISANKEKAKMIAEIENDVDRIIFTQFNYSRSEEANTLFLFSKHPKKELVSDYKLLLKEAFENKNSNEIWIFSGSLYFVSEIRKLEQ